MAKLNKEEHETLKQITNAYVKLKVKLADAAIAQHNAMMGISEMKEKYAEEESRILKKYGSDAIVNIDTGEVRNGNS
jgi:hypothetical protein